MSVFIKYLIIKCDDNLQSPKSTKVVQFKGIVE